ncbi:hypothetical protein D2W70_00950 [Burkholderia pseudomallei]|nr:hypothetical protein D2W49_28725 [Burkholderia pseudomallei]RIV57360.1 hypothetical protein D2W70_00950 [Burkholderia pseudomallei]RIV65951.1 hypothetical protein D2V84_28985 [Burkholderia pseudomallei]RIV75338.1 hypothetical protein D2W72_05530 [Burkholderia pseudomallei]
MSEWRARREPRCVKPHCKARLAPGFHSTQISHSSVQ